MRGRNNEGSVVLDKRIGVWNFFWFDHGNRRTKKIGSLSQYPPKRALGEPLGISGVYSKTKRRRAALRQRSYC